MSTDLRANTASQEIVLGPFVDATDGFTPENGLTINASDIRIFKKGATDMVAKNSGGATLMTAENGLYTAVLDATDTNTRGELVISVYVAGARPVRHEYNVLAEADYDAKYGTPFTSMSAMLNNIFHTLESHRAKHTTQGTVFFVDTVNGDTIANGADGSHVAPLNTITEALSLCTDSAHDMIYLFAGAAGQTTITEAVTISKRYVSIRGPGRDILWTRSGAGNTITITADGVSISGVRITTAGTGTGNGIDISSADFCGVTRCWFESTRGDGINISNGSNTIIEDCILEEVGLSGSGHGIQLDVAGGASTHSFIRRCHISNSPNDGINFQGTVEDTVIEHCSIHGCGGWGIDLSTANQSMLVANVLGDNTSGNINTSSATNSVIHRPTDAGADEDTLKTLSDQIDTIPNAGGGTRTITITIEDQDTNPVSGVTVEVYNAANDTFQGVGLVTDSNGQVVFNLNDDTYTIRQRRVNYVPDDTSETLVVAADAGVTYSGTIFTVSPAAAPDGCVIFGTVRDVQGTAISGATVQAFPVVPQTVSTVQIEDNTVSTTTAADGTFSLELTQGAVVRFVISEANLSFEKTVPAAASQELTAWP